MILIKNTTYELRKQTFLTVKRLTSFTWLGLVVLFTPLCVAEECQFDDPAKESACLRDKVKEVRQDIKTLLTRVQEYKDRTEKADQANREVQKQHAQVIAKKDEIIAKQDEIIKQHEQDTELANRQVSKLRLCCQGTVSNAFRFNVGLGATGPGTSDLDVAGLVGVGIGSLNLHAFLQKDNSGLILGYEF